MENQNNEKLKILIVDDDLFVAELLAARLRKESLETSTATSSHDGFEHIVAQKPSLVILDLDLGSDGDGFGLLERIRSNQQFESIPVIALSNIGSESEMERAIKTGADLYLVKAYVDSDEIIFRVKNVLQKHKVDLPYFHRKFSFKTAADLKLKIEIDLRQPEQNIAVAELVDYIIIYAYITKASDIHLEPEEEKSTVRFRVDGVMQDMFSMTKSLHAMMLTRIKALAGLRTSETDQNQEGHFRSQIENPPQQFEVRVSTLTTYFGENAVLRILSRDLPVTTLEDLLLSDGDLKIIKHAIEKPFGMILITGPTGSGKSTTLYTILRRLNTREVSIVSIEDPVEYTVEGIQQIQVNPRIGLTFAAGLRTILRQDPDVIMVGEIRDRETAGIAINAALTGHLLLSTIHTSDAATTLPRLLDMGIESFLVASTISIAISQRLVRRICPTCKVEQKITAEEMAALTDKLPAKTVSGQKVFYHGRGCEDCGQTGYRGRLGVYEVMEMNDPVRKAVMDRANSEEIKRIAVKNGMSTLLEDGYRKAILGLTTIEEILRVLHE